MPLSPAQAAARARRVGASEVTALLGEHKFSTPRHVYDRIVYGDVVSADLGSPMWVGQVLEPQLLRMAREAFGLRARATQRPAIHPTLPMSASADAIAKDYLVEIKVTSAWGYHQGEMPQYVYDQCVTQAALYRKPVVYLVVLNGSRFWHEPVAADADRFALLEDAVRRFDIEHLTPRIRPPAPTSFSGSRK